MKPSVFYEQNRGAFFNDRNAAAAYAAANCTKEFAPVLLTADRAVEQQFIFQLRWDMEQTVVPVVFSGPIDWLHQPGNDPEFVYAFNRMPF